MGFEFFISYARAKDSDPYRQKLIDALSEAVRDVRGVKTEVGFFDQRELALGDDWDGELVEALQSCKVFVPLYAPAYFNSEYCLKELELFRQRCAASVGPGQPMPPLIMPIIWYPFELRGVPPIVTERQFTFGDPQAVHNVKGIKSMLKQLTAESQSKFNELVDDLARQITAAADAHPLPRLGIVPRLKDVRVGAGAQAAPAPRGPTGPKHVRLVYVAADPHAFGNARNDKAPYVESGGPDWKPFFPASTTRIHRFVQNVVSADDLDFTSEEVRFGANLIGEIDQAWRQRQIVILVVDGWSVHWSADYQALLSQLDGRLDYHWCVLVPSNEHDVDATAIRAEIAKTLNATFDRHANIARNPMFYREGITSPEELKAALREVLTYLKEEIRKRATVDMPMPSGPAKSIITGPSA